MLIGVSEETCRFPLLSVLRCMEELLRTAPAVSLLDMMWVHK